MITLDGATLVLPDRLLSPGTLVIEGDRIIHVVRRESASAPPLAGHFIVPAFVDVHVHGVDGNDTLEGRDAIARIADRLPSFGVGAFCPTTVACTPAQLRGMLDGVRSARERLRPQASRVLPAHLESNFINMDFRGAQPQACICAPHGRAEGDFAGDDILAEIARAQADVGIVTVAPEIEGVLALIPDLVRRGHRVSIGHTGATYDQAAAGIAAGARQATHLFNRMTGLHHRTPGAVGAVLESPDVAAELVCDGVHVHPAAVRAALAAKGADKIMAITDGTGGSGRPPGSTASLGGRRITVRDAAYLDDGTMAGSVLTMDRAFRNLVLEMGVSLTQAAQVCATTPARELGLHGLGVIAPGAIADVVVLDEDLRVVQTYIAGRLAYFREAGGGRSAIPDR